jgi:hypothetical protein
LDDLTVSKHQSVLSDASLDSISHHHRYIQTSSVEKSDELIPPIPKQNVSDTQASSRKSCYVLQYLVSGLTPVLAVKFLEAHDVDKQKGYLGSDRESVC